MLSDVDAHCYLRIENKLRPFSNTKSAFYNLKSAIGTVSADLTFCEWSHVIANRYNLINPQSKWFGEL